MSQSGPPSPPPHGTGARKPDKAPLSKRSYTLNMTFSMLLTAVIVVLIGVSWVFMLGVMVGRGYNPDAKVHEFAERMLRGKRADAAPEPPPTILRPEELNFSLALRDRTRHNSTAVAGMSAGQAPARQANAGAAIHAVKNSTAPVLQPVQPAPQDSQPAIFDFVYQVATFRDAEQADRLRARLEGEGARTVMEKNSARNGKSLYKVLAMRRGTEEDNKELLASLDRLKLGRPLLRSKKAASGRMEGR